MSYIEREEMETENGGAGLGVSAFQGQERRESRSNKGAMNEHVPRVCLGWIFIFGLFPFFLFVLAWDEKWAGGSPNSFIFLIFSSPTKIN